MDTTAIVRPWEGLTTATERLAEAVRAASQEKPIRQALAQAEEHTQLALLEIKQLLANRDIK